MKATALIFVLALVTACQLDIQNQGEEMKKNLQETKKATFAGGCFWCMEPPFENLTGVLDVYAGYTGGHDENPTYDEVSAGSTGHAEAVEIIYDPSQITYEELLRVFWKNVNPTDEGGQFADRGDQYRTAIFYHDQEQKKLAEESKEALEKSGYFDSPIITEIEPYDKFFTAEEYHQDYASKNPIRYGSYAYLSGRKAYVKEQEKKIENITKEYNKPSEEELKKILTDEQFQVTQHGGTEKPFENEYWDNKEPGLYVDVVSGEPLFSSTDKYDSGTGWPSFHKPLDGIDLEKNPDLKLFVPRTEVKSSSGSHLGHVFDDGPTGERYCINSAALRFVPVTELEKEGYAEYLHLFE